MSVDAAHADRSTQGLPGLLGSAGRLVECLRGSHGGQGGHGVAGGEQLLGVGLTSGDGFGVKSGTCRALGQGKRPRGDFWRQGEAAWSRRRGALRSNGVAE